MSFNSIAQIEADGFQVLLTTRTTPVMEVHFNGPFHLLFDNGDVVTATAIDSDYDGIRSTHRVVLWGHPQDGHVAFRALQNT